MVALAVIAAVLVVLGWLGLLVQAQAARGRAQTAADLAALAGASALRDSADGCVIAEQVLRRNGAEPEGCELLGGGRLRVRAAVSAIAGRATAAALAGPANARDG